MEVVAQVILLSQIHNPRLHTYIHTYACRVGRDEGLQGVGDGAATTHCAVGPLALREEDPSTAAAAAAAAAADPSPRLQPAQSKSQR